MSDDQRSSYLPTLDGWRAIAILMVVTNHALRPRFCAETTTTMPCRAILLGGYGVALFFALSGFLITSRLLDERNASGIISLHRFYTRRVFRILPAAFAYLLIIAILAVVTALPVARIEITSSVFFFRNYIPLFLPGHAGMFTTQFWSLAVEEHFYLLWPLILVFAASTKRSLKVALAIAIAIALWRRMDGHFHFIHVTHMPTYQFYFRTDTRLDAILWGCIVALALRDERLGGWIRRALNQPVWLFCVALYAAVIFLRPNGILWITLLSPLLIVGTLLRPDTLQARALEWSLLKWIGRISYSLYLWHPLFMPQYVEARVWPVLQTWPQNVVFAFAAAVLSYYLIERPLIRIGHQLTRATT